MSTLLRIDSSPFDSSTSFSRLLTDQFVEAWRAANPDGQVITRDLALTSPQPISAEWIAASYTPEADRSERQKKVLADSDELIAELEKADEYVFGVPMHNFAAPGVFKLWIDQVVRVGRTVSYEGGQPVGMLQNKKATVLTASGGVYEPGTPKAGMNFLEPYLRMILKYIGVSDVRFINASGTAGARHGVDRSTVVQPALASIHAQFESAVAVGAR